MRRMRAAGLDPDQLTAQQLEAIEGLDKPEKSHWFTHLPGGAGVVALLLALIALFGGRVGDAALYGLVGLLLLYGAYRFQLRQSTKAFAAASGIGLDDLTRDEMAQLNRGAARFLQDPSWPKDARGAQLGIIRDLEDSLRAQPTEWVYHLRLCSAYLNTDQIARAHDAASAAMQLRPLDPRSTYAVATVYNVLTHAKYAEPEFAESLSAVADELPKLVEIGFGISFNPKASEEALGSLGISVDEAASRAVSLFEETLRLNLRQDQRPLVEMSIQDLLQVFPNAKGKQR